MSVAELPPAIQSWQMSSHAPAEAHGWSSWDMIRKDVPLPDLKDAEVLIAIAGCVAAI